MPARAKKEVSTLNYATPKAEDVETIELQDVTAFYSKAYGCEVVEDRAIPDFRDGLKPVHRAALWAMYVNKTHFNSKHKKSARTVGDIIGKYHPHADTSAYGAMVTIANNVMPNLIDGKGNWGSHVDNAAHHRYTEARLSEFSDKFLLDKEYIDIVPMVENYDGTETWPLFLPAKLPVQLLVGSPTVPAYGVSAGTPSFHVEGVSKLIKASLAGKKITARACLKYLKLNNRYGGICTSTDEELLSFYSTGKGSIRYAAEMSVSDQGNEIYINSCCPGGFQSDSSINSSLNKISTLSGVSGISDASGKGAGYYGIKYIIKVKRMDDDAFYDLHSNIEKIVGGSVSFHVGYTHRKKGNTSFGRLSIPQFIEKWTKYRIVLESFVLKNLIVKENVKLDRQNLLLWGTDHIDDIASALKDKKIGPKAHLLKLWKDKTEDFVSKILALQVQQLSSLDRVSILNRKKEIIAYIKSLKADLKVPHTRILRTFNTDVNNYIKKTSDRIQ